MTIPSRLYKYASPSIQNLENLKGQVLYFGSPHQFNDPYDCALSPLIHQPTDEEVEQFRHARIEDPDTTSKQRAELLAMSTDDLRQTILHAGRTTLDQVVSDFPKQRGVTCFSERNDNLLMWSHYGGGYKGFCLEFTTALLPFDKIKKVTYRKDLPIVDFAHLLNTNNYRAVLDELFCTKSDDWAYEAEWRAIHAQANTCYTYPADSLTGVYFGPDISEKSKEIICLILGGQNEIVKFWHGKLSKTKFKVEFEQITYTPYLEAKRRGLL